jgi:large-conductance mechanosensitive channel
MLVTFVISLTVSFIVARMFTSSIDSILDRIIADEISAAWSKYLRFAIYVVGISSGVRIWELEKYVTAPQFDRDTYVVDLTASRWVLEIYRTIIETLQGIASMLLVFFIFALIAFVIVRVFELKRKPEEPAD